MFKPLSRDFTLRFGSNRTIANCYSYPRLWHSFQLWFEGMSSPRYLKLSTHLSGALLYIMHALSFFWLFTTIIQTQYMTFSWELQSYIHLAPWLFHSPPKMLTRYLIKRFLKVYGANVNLCLSRQLSSINTWRVARWSMVLCFRNLAYP